MLNLPQSTEVKRPLPKAQLYKRFDWKPSQRECFDGNVSRLDFVNWIAPRTVPAIAAGDEVKEIFVVEISLKSHDFDTKAITLLAKHIPQRIVYLLRYEGEAMLAVYHTMLFSTPWRTVEDISLPLSGLNLDVVWENIVSSIGQFTIEENNSLSEQIRNDEERNKLIRQIEALKKQMNSTKQPRRKRELFSELAKLTIQITPTADARAVHPYKDYGKTTNEKY
ncbi:MAG: DUF4391 domain-containing protein [Muribaculaceae bacterium]|nr:DUF4391 domain-containing protein [Muribaculaceae bacterium]